VARELGETSLMFKVHPTLSETDLADTCLAVSKVMQSASRDWEGAGKSSSGSEIL
jgi:hypothetical protein